MLALSNFGVCRVDFMRWRIDALDAMFLCREVGRVKMLSKTPGRVFCGLGGLLAILCVLPVRNIQNIGPLTVGVAVICVVPFWILWRTIERRPETEAPKIATCIALVFLLVYGFGIFQKVGALDLIAYAIIGCVHGATTAIAFAVKKLASQTE